MRWIAMAGLALALDQGVAMLHADAPRAIEQDRKVYSHNKRFFVVSQLKERHTAVFRAGSGKITQWDMAGYSSILFLSDDGQHLVVGYPGGNILAEDAKTSDALLTFFTAGRCVGTVTVGELFPHPQALPQTTSGRAWGNFWGFDGPRRFSLLLNDNQKISFDVDTGKRTRD